MALGGQALTRGDEQRVGALAARLLHARERRHLVDGLALVVQHERHARAGAACPAGAADAMHVARIVVRRIEVDDVRDRIDVQATRCDVGRHEGVGVPAREALEGARALRLRHVAVQGRDADAAALEARRQPARAALGAHEHERELALVPQHVDEAVELLLVERGQESVLDCAHLGLGRVVLDAHGVARVFRCEAVDLAVERGGEEERLALPANLADDAVDGRAEAQVEHAVGLVEDEQGDAVEADEAPLKEILQPARRRHEDVGARGLLGLAVDADSAEGRGDAQAAGARDGRGLLCDLHGELARRHQHESGGNARVAAQALDHRDRERECLAAAGRRFCEHVPPCQCVGQDELLDGEEAEMPRCCSAAHTCSDAPRARKDWVLKCSLLAVDGPFGV